MTATAEAPAKPKAKKPKEKAKPVAKKATAKPVHGIEREHDLPWCDKKVALFKALKALKATSPTNGQPASAVAEKGNISQRDVRHYSYAAAAAGLVGIDTEAEGGRGYLYFLTAKGAAIDPAKALKEQESTKK